jgi:capsid protein
MAERQRYPFRRNHGHRAPRVELREHRSGVRIGSQRPRTKGWNAPESTANSGLLYELRTIRNRSRRAVANDGYAKGTIDRLVTNIIGTGRQAALAGEDEPSCESDPRLFDRWTTRATRMACSTSTGSRRWQSANGWKPASASSAAVRAARKTSLSVPLQLQIIEPEQLALEYDTIAANGNRIRGGVEFDGIGRRVAYYFYPRASRHRVLQQRHLPPCHRPTTSSRCTTSLRAGQIRGVPRADRGARADVGTGQVR